MSKNIKDAKIVKCDDCDFKWNVDEIKVHTQVIKNEKGQEMSIRFFICPECKKVYVVDIMDFKARMLKKKYDKRLSENVKAIKARKQTKAHIDRTLKASEEYKKYQRLLKDKYSSCLYLRIEGDGTTTKNVD